MADATNVVFSGLFGLEGRTVDVFCVGLDCGSYVVTTTGTVTVPFASDPDGLFTIARIQSMNGLSLDWGPLATKIDVYVSGAVTTYTVPACIGMTFTSKGQVLRPLAESEIKSSQGHGLGKKRRVHQVGVLLDEAIGVSFGTTFDNVVAATFRDAAGDAMDNNNVFSGVYWDTVTDIPSYDGQVCWQITRPYPATIVSLTGFMQTEEN